METVILKETVGGILTLDWCTEEYFIKTFIENPILFDNKKDILYITKEDNSFNSIESTLESNYTGTFYCSFSLLLFNRQEFEDYVFGEQTLESISELNRNINKTNSVLQSFIAIPSSLFVPLKHYTEVL